MAIDFLEKPVKKILTSFVVLLITSTSFGKDEPRIEFGPRVSFPIRGNAIGVTHGDFDGDGFVDVAAGNNSLSIATVLFGDGSGQLGASVEIPNPGNIVLELAADDLNGNGRDELVFTGHSGGVAVAFGETDRTFSVDILPSTSNTSDIDIVDLDRDNNLDIVVASRSNNAFQFLLYGNGDGTFANAIRIQASGILGDVAVADYDQDGFLDVAASSTHSFLFSINFGSAVRDLFNLVTYPVANGFTNGLITGDFNRDAIPDLAYTLSSNAIEIALGSGDGTFDKRFRFDSPSRLVAIDSGDFNGDGILDLASVTQNDRTIAIYAGLGDGTFLRRADLMASANGTQSLDVFDLNGDGLDDIVVAAASGANVDLFLSSYGVFVPPMDFTAFRGTEISASISDFADSDDVSAIYRIGSKPLGDLEAPVSLIFDAVAPAATDYRVESTAGTPHLTYTTEAFNWGTNDFEVIGIQNESFNSDTVADFAIVPADHIDASGNVRSRVGWRQTGFVINFPWEVRVDQTGWVQNAGPLE